jgi:hypothetical protein
LVNLHEAFHFAIIDFGKAIIDPISIHCADTPKGSQSICEDLRERFFLEQIGFGFA